MKLINNRYKMIICLDKNESKYLATDLFKKDRKVLMYIVKDSSYTRDFLNYCTENFYTLSSYKHPNLLCAYSFDIIESIDDKPNYEGLYYYTTEYIDTIKALEVGKQFDKESILHFYKQLSSCLQYLHFRGFYYKLMNRETILMNKAGQQLKLLDLVSIKKKEMEKKHMESSLTHFAALELSYDTELGGYTDIYSLGAVLYAAYTGEEFYPPQLQRKIQAISCDPNKQWEYNFFSLIKAMTNFDFTERTKNIYETNERIMQLYNLAEKIDNQKQLEVLSFKTPIIGRDTELQQVVSAVKIYEGRKKKQNTGLILVTGDKGIGKTRFINEVVYRKRLKKYRSYHTTITVGEDNFFSIMPMLLRKMLKEADPSLIKKYGGELVTLIPEIGLRENNDNIRELPIERELLRLYDRVANFIITLTMDKPSIITIDNINIGDVSIVKFIDYFISLNILKKAPVRIILTLNTEAYRYTDIEGYIKKWKAEDSTIEIKLGRLTVEETADMIQNILGWHERPLNLASEITKDTEGNPYAVEEVLKEMYREGFIKIDWDGTHKEYVWKKATDHYFRPQFFNDFDEASIKQAESLNELHKKVLEVICVFKTAVSLEIINKMLGEKQDFSPYLEELVALKVLNEKLEDWGYTYGFYNKQLKQYIYNNINKTKRGLMHILASNTLEEIYKLEARENKEELIYHLLQANQRGKAIEYCMEAGDSMYRLRVYSQALYFYDRAYKLFQPTYNEKKTDIIMKLANTYQKQGNNEKAIQYYKEIISLAEKYNDFKIMIDTINKIGHIYLLRNETDTAIDYLENNIALATTHRKHHGLLEAGYLLSNGYINTRKLQEAEALCDNHLQLATKYENNGYIGLFFNQKGIIRHLKNEPLEAIKLFKDSVYYLEEADKRQDAAKTLNNIGNVFLDYFQDSKNARNYYERALEITQEFYDIEVMVRSYQGIAAAYMLEDQYKKAVNLLNRNIELSLGLQDKSIRIKGYLYAIDCYVILGEYKKAYSYLLKVEKEQQVDWKQGIHIGKYYEVAAKYYIAIGRYQEALNCIEDYNQDKMLQQTNCRQELKIQTIEFFIKWQLKQKVEDEALLSLMEKYNRTSYNRDRRELLLDAFMYFYVKQDWNVLQQIQKEDDDLVAVIDSDYMKLCKTFIKAILADSAEEKIDILKSMLSIETEETWKELRWKIYKALGEAYFELNEFYQATSYYLQALYIIKILYFKVPEEFKSSYLLSSEKHKIKERLLNMEELINTGGFYFYKSIDKDITSKKIDIDAKNFFEISSLQILFKNPEFYKLALEEYEKEFPFSISSIKELVSIIGYNTEYNLELLLKLAAKNLLATKAAIISAYSDYKTVVSLGQEIMMEEINHILEKVSRNKKGLYINNIKNFMEADKGFMYHETKAFICLPIIEQNPEGPNLQKEKRQNKAVKLLGYLYLETDKIFNKFTLEGYEECQKLLALAAILLDNYHLRITSFTDKLTGVFTRKHFEYVLEEEVEKAKNQNLSFSIIMSDIDHFKGINDTYGHQKGDVLLSKVGELLKKSIRKTDIIGRYGGEEFIILLPQTSKQQAYKIAEKIRYQLQETVLLDRENQLTISCGIAAYNEDAVNKETIIEKADQALYTAKERGRNQTVVWEKGISFNNKRADKLAGIITGNVVKDQQNVLVMAEAIELIEKQQSVAEKIFIVLGRLVELLQVEEGFLLQLAEKEIVETYGRRRFQDTWVKNVKYNHDLIQKVIETKKGEFLIDWQDIGNSDSITGTPNWKSIMTVPIIHCEKLKGIMYFTVPSQEKELDFYAYNIAKTTGGIIAAFINNTE